MASVTIRNLPDGLFERLRDRARRNRRSITQEAAWILEAALSEATTPAEAWAEVERVREMVQRRYGSFPDSSADIRSDRER
jgi:plasmid stability protein